MKAFNKVELKGRIVSYDLDTRTTESGIDAVSGSVKVAVDENNTEVEARFFAPEHFSSGKHNTTFDVLSDIMNGNDIEWVAIDGNIDINYFVGRDGAKTTDDLSRTQRVRGSFIKIDKTHQYINKWTCDMVITRVDEVEADEEKHRAHSLTVQGYIFDTYRERALQVKFSAFNPSAIQYLMAQDISKDSPIYSSVRGDFKKVSTSVIRESAFGDENETIEYSTTYWELTWMPKNAYIFGEDITVEVFEKYLDELEKFKSEQIKKNEESETADLVF